MSIYYAVANVNGPISFSIEAESSEAAEAQFEEMSAEEIRDRIDDAATDAEDYLDFCGDGFSEEEFADALRAYGCTEQCGLTQHWTLWAGPEEIVTPKVTTEFSETAEESEGDDPAPGDLCYYITANVSLAGESYSVGVMVGAHLCDHGSVRASGAGVRPVCDAWTIDISDMQGVPKWAEQLVRNALIRDSYSLYCAAQESEAERANSRSL